MKNRNIRIASLFLIMFMNNIWGMNHVLPASDTISHFSVKSVISSVSSQTFHSDLLTVSNLLLKLADLLKWHIPYSPQSIPPPYLVSIPKLDQSVPINKLPSSELSEIIKQITPMIEQIIIELQSQSPMTFITLPKKEIDSLLTVNQSSSITLRLRISEKKRLIDVVDLNSSIILLHQIINKYLYVAHFNLSALLGAIKLYQTSIPQSVPYTRLPVSDYNAAILGKILTSSPSPNSTFSLIFGRMFKILMCDITPLTVSEAMYAFKKQGSFYIQKLIERINYFSEPKFSVTDIEKRLIAMGIGIIIPKIVNFCISKMIPIIPPPSFKIKDNYEDWIKYNSSSPSYPEVCIDHCSGSIFSKR